MNKLFKLGILFVFVLSVSGCSQNRAYKTWTTDPYVQDTFNESINDIANQLLKNSRIKVNDKIAIASFVDLDKLNKTTHFGRNLSESMFDELHVRGFNVVDVRGSKTLRINATGEFFITRDIRLLNQKRVENTYILVATYSKFGNGILLNARIMDNLTGEVVSTARTIIDVNDCDIFENCSKTKVVVEKIIPKRTISLSDAGCSYVTCPTNCTSNKCGNDENLNVNVIMTKSIPKVKACLGCR